MRRHSRDDRHGGRWVRSARSRELTQGYLADCSCVYCTSPRKHGRKRRGTTIKERLALLADLDDRRSLALVPES